MQRIQQQIGLINVVKAMPKEMLNGRRLDIGPALDQAFELLFGAQVAPFILIDERDLFTIEPDQENEMILNGMTMETHLGDDDQAHLKSHTRAAAATGDPTHGLQAHMARHLLQLYKKSQAAGSHSPTGLQGMPGGGGPGAAGTPRPGALPAPQKAAQNPAGAVHQDEMSDAQMPGRE